MEKSNIPEYDELREFCDTLKEKDVICRQCAMALKHKISIASRIGSGGFGTIGSILSPPNMELHSSCVIRLLAHAKGFF